MSAVSQFVKILKKIKWKWAWNLFNLSAQPVVLKAAMLQAKEDNSIILIESYLIKLINMAVTRE